MVNFVWVSGMERVGVSSDSLRRDFTIVIIIIDVASEVICHPYSSHLDVERKWSSVSQVKHTNCTIYATHNMGHDAYYAYQTHNTTHCRF